MKAMLLAGGRGSRFKDVTLTIPKPLITVGGKELIRHVLDVLPCEITECVIVLGHLGHLIRARLGDMYGRFTLSYLYQSETGTGGTLLSTKPLMANESVFFVVGCDDIFGKNELSKLMRPHPVYGIRYGVPRKSSRTEVLFNNKNMLKGFGPVADETRPRYFGVGAYILPSQIFNEKFFRLPSGELSIPHTLARCSFSIEVVVIEDWMPVNDPTEKEIAEKRFICDKPR